MGRGRGGWWCGGAVVLGSLLLGGAALAANDRIVVDQVLASWQGNAQVQLVQLRMVADGQNTLSGTAQLVFDGPTGVAESRRFFTFVGPNPQRAAAGSRILVATTALASSAAIEPDYVLPPGLLSVEAGRVCYAGFNDGGQLAALDCVSWGAFTGDPLDFGPPVRRSPDNRVLVRLDPAGRGRDAWDTRLEPALQTNAGALVTLATLCGNARIEQGEVCDGTSLGGATCASLGFARGTLVCDQCHFETGECTACGNGVINGSEQCDGADTGDRSCESLGFTGGGLGCSKACKISTATCDPTFDVPGGGPAGVDCFAEWRVTNAGARPRADGKAATRQRCKDGDAGCDADTVTGTCTFRLAVCLNRLDARLKSCRLGPLTSWTLMRPLATAAGPEAEVVARLPVAVGKLGPASVAAGDVAFVPPLTAAALCTETVAVQVPRAGRRPGKLVMKARAVAGSRRDADTLTLVCAP